ncbi:MAG: hypothetical protein IJ821_07310 [Lachnospiraceae bacterium]|nr:hypothetical protein [Lachnospiraceae bacterium]
MNILWRSNSTKYRLIRTILQGIISVVIINLDLLLGYLIIPNELRPVLTALVMAILSPMMSELGKMLEEKESE